jgi:LacI family transcriptional regulator
MPVTIKDLARELNVSCSTVSRALSNSPRVAKKTRKTIQKLAREMGYRKDGIASALVTGKNNVIGVIVTDTVRHMNMAVIHGAEKVARERGFNIILCNAESTLEGEISSTEVLKSQKVSGIIFVSKTGYKDIDHICRARDEGIPIAVINRFIEDKSIDTFVGDYFNSGGAMIDHLIEEGHRNITFVGYGGPLISKSVVDRIEGYRSAMRRAELEEDLVLHPNFNLETTAEMEIETGHQLMEKILTRGKLPSAILATDDFFAAGILRALYRRNILVPDDMTLVCYNDAIAAYQTPPLTIIGEPFYEAGKMAATLIMDRISGEDIPIAQRKVGCELIVRESCRCGLRDKSNLS